MRNILCKPVITNTAVARNSRIVSDKFNYEESYILKKRENKLTIFTKRSIGSKNMQHDERCRSLLNSSQYSCSDPSGAILFNRKMEVYEGFVSNTEQRRMP